MLFFPIFILLFGPSVVMGHQLRIMNPDPDEDRSTCEIVFARGFPCEVHTVVTYEGYIIELHRIPHPGAKVVLLIPGLVGNSAEFVMASTKVTKDPKLVGRNMALELYKQGYDVWMANNRGSKYGMKHVRMKHGDKKFWKFCFDNIAKYDVPSFFDYIRRFTGKDRFHVIGHSQGTSVIFALLSESPKYNHMIESFIAISPVTRVKNARTILKPVLSMYKRRFERNGGPAFARKSRLSGRRITLACDAPFSRTVCVLLYSLVSGPNLKQLDLKRIGVYTAQMPTTTAAQNLIHYDQVFKSNKFQKFDHGVEVNLIRYGRPSPPEYDLTKITHPNTYVIYARNDWYAPMDGIKTLKRELKYAKEFYEISDPKANHMDPLIGIESAVEVNLKVIHILAKYH